MHKDKRGELARSYIPTVKRIAAGFARKVHHNVNIDDLFGAGLLGLAEAISRHNQEQDAQFRFFVEVRIRGAMIDEMRFFDPLSRVLREKSTLLRKTIDELERLLGRQPEESEIARNMGQDMKQYRAMLLKLQSVTVLSFEIVENDRAKPRGYPERIPGNPFDDYVFSGLMGRLNDAISKLSERDQMVLVAYYKNGRSLREIGESNGITEARICQIRGKAILRIRAMMEAQR